MRRAISGLLLLLASFAVFASTASDSEKVVVEATITLGEETLGTPRLVVEAGKQFSVKIGKEGERLVSLSGMAAPINDRSMATDFTLELEQPGKVGTELRRVTQTIKTGMGEFYVIRGIQDTAGKELKLVLKVGMASRP